MTETDGAADPHAPAETPDDEVDTSHLDGVGDGCGCAEIWEHLSESRETAAAEADD